MTYNIGAGKGPLNERLDLVIEIIKRCQPDILAIQEATEWVDGDGLRHSDLDSISSSCDLPYSAFSPTLSMAAHMDTRKPLFVRGLFSDWLDWAQGNALASRFPFSQLANTARPGLPRRVPITKVAEYQGNRDTDPRDVLLARLRLPTLNPFVITFHGSTLIGERERIGGFRAHAARAEDAQFLRLRESLRIVDLLRAHVLETNSLAFLMGDFNATPGEAAISHTLVQGAGFVRLVPKNSNVSTHAKTTEPIDHILVYPPSRVLEYSCNLVDDELTRRASDHLPVLADLKLATSPVSTNGH